MRNVRHHKGGRSDFDWGGLRIANLVMKRHGARPWRFATEDYLAAAGAGGKKLDLDEKKRAAAAWDPHLEEVMVERGRAVHEEQLLDVLLADLAQTATPRAPEEHPFQDNFTEPGGTWRLIDPS